ncbi:carboxypeptidase cpdS [Paracoccidioides lutzii Pb01]|uniref:Carboxypeptidase n=1 Tax=Paracoccidioides lutzii (strain ATCC MYA-826 / Pb01) TaxID=502779 RepID=C1H627_PARBA|nr:carboxypeptidase cpdS [Paracoccidioides lutzii Pb01]EEH35090.2 carboxypeptidase cpdS [Paracoccidioides lutzii Pb01]
MHSSIGIIAGVLLTTVAALSNPHDRARRFVDQRSRYLENRDSLLHPGNYGGDKPFKHLNPKTEEFLVRGRDLPEVDFDIGESYAGTLPNSPSGNSSLWFWFFPSENPAASEEITVFLNGGPGCSSLLGLLQENGPFLWQPGTYKPVINLYSWTNLTNMVWIDQPAGTGFSPGPPTVEDEIDVANQFNDFWKRFMERFDLMGRRVFLTGESYAGMYIPYIANKMLEKRDNRYFDLQGIWIMNPVINEDDTMITAPSVPALNYYQSVIQLNESTLADVNRRYESCGYAKFMNMALQFPPTGKLPSAPKSNGECNLWEHIVTAATYVNPCFNIYNLREFCPLLWNVMRFPLTVGPSNYFNRTDVQKVLHTPPTDYMLCNMQYKFFPEGDKSPPSGLGPLPNVIEKTNNTIIAHGALDFLLFLNGTLITIQNMTWNGAQGFQKAPSEKLFVPYHPGLGEIASRNVTGPFTQVAGAGQLGTVHTERGLTWVTVDLSGHKIPQYSPGFAYRTMELLLGRIESLSQRGSFTTLPEDFE